MHVASKQWAMPIAICTATGTRTSPPAQRYELRLAHVASGEMTGQRQGGAVASRSQKAGARVTEPPMSTRQQQRLQLLLAA